MTAPKPPHTLRLSDHPTSTRTWVLPELVEPGGRYVIVRDADATFRFEVDERPLAVPEQINADLLRVLRNLLDAQSIWLDEATGDNWQRVKGARDEAEAALARARGETP